MCREAPHELLWLEHASVTFHPDEHSHLGTRALVARRRRGPTTAADITGHALLQVLYLS